MEEPTEGKIIGKYIDLHRNNTGPFQTHLIETFTKIASKKDSPQKGIEQFQTPSKKTSTKTASEKKELNKTDIETLVGRNIERQYVPREVFCKAIHDNKNWIEKRNSEVSVEEFKQLLKEYGKLLTDKDKKNIQAINKEIDKLWEELHPENEKKYELNNGEKLTMREFFQSYDIEYGTSWKAIFKDTRTFKGYEKVPMTPKDPECSAFDDKDYDDFNDKIDKIKQKWQEKREIILSEVQGTDEYFFRRNPEFQYFKNNLWYSKDSKKQFEAIKNLSEENLEKVKMIFKGTNNLVSLYEKLIGDSSYLDRISEEDCKKINSYYSKNEYFPISYYLFDSEVLEKNLAVLRKIPKLKGEVICDIISHFRAGNPKIQELANYDWTNFSEALQYDRSYYSDENNHQYFGPGCAEFLCGLLKGDKKAEEFYENMKSGKRTFYDYPAYH